MYSTHEVAQIQGRKNEIEAWYHEGFPNYNLIAGLDSPEENLTELRNLKNEREKLYSKIEEKSPLALALFLDKILYYPDIIIRKRITKEKKDSKIIVERDYLDSQKRQAAKHYKEAIEKIQNAVDRENRKLREKHHSFALYPISVKIYNPYNEIESFTHRPPGKHVKLIKDLSNILSLYCEKQTDRASIIEDAFRSIYGIPEGNIDHRTIARQC